MAITVHNSIGLLFALLSLTAVAGCCCQAIPLPGENQCPTDARRLYCSCGEEAVRRCPCGPGSEFYGLKPTCWREWPEGWHCNGCEGMPYVDRAMCGEPIAEAPVDGVTANEAQMVESLESEKVDLSNPFRSDPGAAELPVPPQTPHLVPEQLPQANTAPLQWTPAQPAASPPALEKVPTPLLPSGPMPPTTTPSAKTSATEKLPLQATSAESVRPLAPTPTPAVATVAQVEAAVPKPMPIVPEAVKMTANPILIPPQNAPAILAVTEPSAQPAQAVAEPKMAKKPETKESGTLAPKHSALSNRVEQHLLNNLRL